MISVALTLDCELPLFPRQVAALRSCDLICGLRACSPLSEPKGYAASPAKPETLADGDGEHQGVKPDGRLGGPCPACRVRSYSISISR